MNVEELIKQMTLEEKASLCSGKDFWHTKDIERLNIPKTMVSDGPHGLRKQDLSADHLGINDSIKAVCFPAGCLTAASFDRNLLEKLGKTLGNECQAENVSVLLGPAMNIKRSPLCGRNFEYYSEDPLLSTEMAGALIKGVQSENVGTSPKHFLANNQEHRRMTSSSEVDERTLREIYLASFEKAVVEQKPWTIMCSYNRINGTYAAENKKFLTDILRDEWGFDGYVVSDWGAVNDRVPDLEAGLDLEMPSSHGVNDKKIVNAVKEGKLDEKILDKACKRILNIVYKYTQNHNKAAVFDRDKDHEIAKEVAKESMVLLKNDNILPLDDKANIAFIGKYAKEPRYQGGGSSHVNSSKVTSAIDAVSSMKNISYAKGFDDKKDEVDIELIKEAKEKAKDADVAVLFVGLPDSFESEGYDRTHMDLPDCQNKLINEVCSVQENVVVVLHNGSPIEMPWIENVKGVLESYLGGQAVGAAQKDILFGYANPSGKLPETFPMRLKDNPSYLFYGGEKDVAEYREGVFVGYRYYDSKEMDVLFPFGHGLSYTKYEYSNMEIDKTSMKDTDTLTVSVDIKNIGKMKGKEIVQLYVSPNGGEIIRPIKELKGFEKVELEPNETKSVKFELNKRAFAYWNIKINDWHVESGKYKILIGKSSREIECEKEIEVQSTVKIPVEYTMDSTVGDIMQDEEKAQILNEMKEKLTSGFGAGSSEESSEAINNEMVEAMMKYMPLRNIMSFAGVEEEIINELLDKLNE